MARHRDGSAAERRHRSWRQIAAVTGELTRQFVAQAADDEVTVRGGKAAQGERVDVDVHPWRAHDQPRISASLSGRSSLALSARAAASRCVMRIGEDASAARNAALSAMLRM